MTAKNEVSRSGTDKSVRKLGVSDNKGVKSKKNTQPSEKQNSKPMRADEAVMLRNEFYKDGHKTLKYLMIAAGICLIISTITTFFAVSKEGKNHYFAVDEAGQFIELITLDRPNHNAAVISQWLTDALIDTFDFNYLNMKQVLNDKALIWFTESGRTSLIDSIENSGSFNVIQRERLIAQLNLIRSPILVREGIGRTGMYEWILQVEGKLTYTNESSVYTNNVIFTVSVTRRSMLEDIKGLGINRIIVEFSGR